MPSPQDRVLLACFIHSKSPGVAAVGTVGKEGQSGRQRHRGVQREVRKII